MPLLRRFVVRVFMFSVSPAPLLAVLLACVAGAASGWVVSRASQRVVVVPYLLSYLLYAVVATWLFVQSIRMDPHTYSSSEWRDVVISFASLVVFVPVGIIAGGIRSRFNSASS